MHATKWFIVCGMLAAAVCAQAGTVFSENFGSPPDHTWINYGTPALGYTTLDGRTVAYNSGSPTYQIAAVSGDAFAAPVNVADGDFSIQETIRFNTNTAGYSYGQIYVGRGGSQPIVPGQLAFVEFQGFYWGYQTLFVSRYTDALGNTETAIPVAQQSSNPNAPRLAPDTFETITIARNLAGVWTVTGSASGLIMTATETPGTTGSSWDALEIRNANETLTSPNHSIYWDSIQVSAVPEPASLVLLSLGGLFLSRRKK